MASTTEDVLRRHVKCFSEGDLEGLVSDYSADAVLFTPNGPLKGHGPIREFFRTLIRNSNNPGTSDGSLLAWTNRSAALPTIEFVQLP